MRRENKIQNQQASRHTNQFILIQLFLISLFKLTVKLMYLYAHNNSRQHSIIFFIALETVRNEG